MRKRAFRWTDQAESYYSLVASERLKLILKAMDDCGEEPTFAAVGKQYRYETGHALDREMYERAVRRKS